MAFFGNKAFRTGVFLILSISLSDMPLRAAEGACSSPPALQRSASLTLSDLSLSPVSTMSPGSGKKRLSPVGAMFTNNAQRADLRYAIFCAMHERSSGIMVPEARLMGKKSMLPHYVYLPSDNLVLLKADILLLINITYQTALKIYKQLYPFIKARQVAPAYAIQRALRQVYYLVGKMERSFRWAITTKVEEWDECGEFQDKPGVKALIKELLAMVNKMLATDFSQLMEAHQRYFEQHHRALGPWRQVPPRSAKE